MSSADVFADYESVPSLKGMIERSDLIVIGTVVESSSNTTPAADPEEGETIPEYKIGVKVQEALKSEFQVERGAELEIIELGGMSGGVIYRVVDQPSSRIGLSYLYFLSERDGRFEVVAGPQGRYLVEEGGGLISTRDEQCNQDTCTEVENGVVAGGIGAIRKLIQQ